MQDPKDTWPIPHLMGESLMGTRSKKSFLRYGINKRCFLSRRMNTKINNISPFVCNNNIIDHTLQQATDPDEIALKDPVVPQCLINVPIPILELGELQCGDQWKSKILSLCNVEMSLLMLIFVV